MHNRKKIGAVVVLYHPTRSEVENIATYSDEVDYLVIVDNSEDSHEKLLGEVVGIKDHIQYISHVENIGLCKALNEGIAILKNHGCNWTIVFDADSKAHADVFTIYKDILNQYKDIENVALFAPQHSFDRNVKEKYKGYKEVKWAMTSGWMLNCSVFEKIGGFFEPLFVDGLDMDYCYKAAEYGYKVMEVGEAIIEHHPAETKELVLLGKTFKYGWASPYRYFMQARCLTWTSLRYKQKRDILVYLYKWFKVLFLFNEKKKYISEMIKGTKEGRRLYRQYKENSSNRKVRMK